MPTTCASSMTACGAATRRPLRRLGSLISLNAACAVGLSTAKGSLEVGKGADLVLLDDQFHVKLTVAEGVVVYDAGKPDASASG